MFSRVNFKGIIVLLVIFLAIQLAFGFIVSPFIKDVGVRLINKSGMVRMQVDSLRIWPLTLKVSVSGAKVYEPEDDERIATIGSASCRLSFLALLSKRLVISGIHMKGVDIMLVGEPDGGFNIEKIIAPEKEEEKRSFFDRFKKAPGDWFSRIYRIIKSQFSGEGLKQQKKEIKEMKSVKTEVKQLPKGREVEFRTGREGYLLEIRRLRISDSRINLYEGETDLLDIKDVDIVMDGMVMDPVKGADISRAEFRGRLVKGETDAGRFDMRYSKVMKRDNIVADIYLTAKDIDLPSAAFIYDESLPVIINKGKLSIDSDTRLVDQQIDSRNRITLRGQDIQPVDPDRKIMGMIPMNILTEAFNQTEPLKLEFKAEGDVSSPEITGYQKTFQELVKPYMENVVKEEGTKALKSLLGKELGVSEKSGTTSEDGGSSAEKTIDTIKSLFNKK